MREFLQALGRLLKVIRASMLLNILLLLLGCLGMHELGHAVVLVSQKLLELFDHGHVELAGWGLVIPFHFV
jgi:hypothetical protein